MIAFLLSVLLAPAPPPPTIHVKLWVDAEPFDGAVVNVSAWTAQVGKTTIDLRVPNQLKRAIVSNQRSQQQQWETPCKVSVFTRKVNRDSVYVYRVVVEME